MSKHQYICHWILLKATRAKQISDTVFFKHKYITQSTLTPEDLVIKTIQNPTNSIKVDSSQKDDVQINTITRLADALKPGYELPVQQMAEQHPTEQHKEANQATKSEPLTTQAPRVQFDYGSSKEWYFDKNEPF